LGLCVRELSFSSRGVFRGSASQQCGPEQRNGANRRNANDKFHISISLMPS
jgi:hypothetical protein